MEDLLGNPLTLNDSASLAPINTFVDGFLACEARAADVLIAADDPSPMVQAYCATVHLFAESRDAASNARPFIERAAAACGNATEREQRYIGALRAWALGDIAGAISRHQKLAQEYPRDLASIKLGQYHCFNAGDSAAMLRLALLALPAAADVCYLQGMAAFGFEQCHMMREAEASARRAIEMRRKEPWAHHALGHVMLTEGRLAEGLDFMRSVSDSWIGLNSFMETHNWWHVALFLIDLGRDEEALAIYDQHVWGVVKEYSQDQIGAVSLLARLELAGIDVGERWQDVADYLTLRLEDHVLPFLDLQYLYGLARAGRREADTLLRNIEAFAPEAPPSSHGVWQHVAVPAARGLLAHARGDFAGAVQALGMALPRLSEIGGSHAQRDLFDQIYLDALMRSGTTTMLERATELLRPQIGRQPESRRMQKQAAAAASLLAKAGAPLGVGKE